MAILLSWKNNNVPQHTLRVYRSEGVIDTKALPPPLATLPGNAVSYTDETAIGGKTYNYLVQVTDGTDSIFTAIPSVMNVKNRGPGPQILQQGDFDCGYFGEISAFELPNLFTAFGYPSAYVNNNDAYPDVFHKFAWKGRILYVGSMFIPFAFYSSDVTRNKHTRSGVKFNFTNAATEKTVENIHSYNGFSYHARCPRSTPENWDGKTSAFHIDNLINPDTEFNQIIGSLTRHPAPVKRKLSGIVTNTLVGAPYFYGIAVADVPVNTEQAFLTRLALGASGAILRVLMPARANNFDANNPAAHAAIAGDWFATQISNTSNAQPWPVFELIEN